MKKSAPHHPEMTIRLRRRDGFEFLLEFDENDRPDFLELEEILQNY